MVGPSLPHKCERMEAGPASLHLRSTNPAIRQPQRAGRGGAPLLSCFLVFHSNARRIKIPWLHCQVEDGEGLAQAARPPCYLTGRTASVRQSPISLEDQVSRGNVATSYVRFSNDWTLSSRTLCALCALSLDIASPIAGRPRPLRSRDAPITPSVKHGAQLGPAHAPWRACCAGPPRPAPAGQPA